MFAGAFLYAVTQGHSHAEAAALGNHAAAQVVAQYGNRLSAASVAAVRTHFPA
jgi:sugar/nucleoside kinase (ribokinase family)